MAEGQSTANRGDTGVDGVRRLAGPVNQMIIQLTGIFKPNELLCESASRLKKSGLGEHSANPNSEAVITHITGISLYR